MPGRWRLLQAAGSGVGTGGAPSGKPLKFDADDVSDLFFAISELRGKDYNVTGRWASNMQAIVFKDKTLSRY